MLITKKISSCLCLSRELPADTCGQLDLFQVTLNSFSDETMKISCVGSELLMLVSISVCKISAVNTTVVTEQKHCGESNTLPLQSDLTQLYHL